MIKYYVTDEEVKEDLKPMDCVIVWENNQPIPANIIDNNSDSLLVYTNNNNLINVDNIICKLW